DKERLEIKAENFEFVQVFDGDKGWMKMGDNTMDISKEQVAEEKESLYVHEIARLYPLKNSECKLTSLGETKVGDRTAIGIKVEHKAHRPVSLYFDKQSGLLIKFERKAKDFMGGQEGQEYTQESVYDNFKEVNGLKMPHKVTINRDGKKFVEEDVTE